MRVALRSRSRRVHRQRTIVHHVVWSGNERRQTDRLPHIAYNLLLRFFRRATVMRLRRVTTLTRVNCRDRVINHPGSHHAVAAPENASAGHPDRNDDGRQQTHRPVREEQSHAAWQSTSGHKKAQGTRQSFVRFVAHFCNESVVSLKHREKRKDDYR